MRTRPRGLNALRATAPAAVRGSISRELRYAASTIPASSMPECAAAASAAQGSSFMLVANSASAKRTSRNGLAGAGALGHPGLSQLRSDAGANRVGAGELDPVDRPNRLDAAHRAGEEDLFGSDQIADAQLAFDG